MYVIYYYRLTKTMDTLDRQWRTILENFPSSFIVDPELYGIAKEKKIKTIIKKLNDDYQTTTKSETESVNILNFLSYLYFVLEDKTKALQYCDDSLRRNPDGIIANANKARFLLESGEGVYDVEEIIAKLQELGKREDYDKQKCYAEADLAYAYSRAGPLYHDKAAELYIRVVKERPEEYEWRFRLGLTLLRQSHVINSQAKDKFESTDRLIEAANHLFTVAENTNDTSLSGKAWSKLGATVFQLANRADRDAALLPGNLCGLKAETCFEKAIELSPDEQFVLEICGQFAHYLGNLEDAESFLRKSLKINPTVHAYHHLALTLQAKVEQTKRSCTERERWFNSPLHVLIEPENTLLQEAVALLQEAVGRDKCALLISYDMGIIYRMLDEPLKAVSVFKEIISRQGYLTSPTLLTNVFEQLGICMMEMSKSDVYPRDQREKCHKNGKSYLHHAVELQADVVAADPDFKKSFNSYSTLKDLLFNKAESCKELAKLHSLMGDHGDSIDLYNKLKEDTPERMTSDDYIDMLESYIKIRNFDDAVLLLKVLELKTCFEEIPQSLKVDVFVAGAFHAFAAENVLMAKQCFRSAFFVYNKPCGETEPKTDILILHSCDNAECKRPSSVGEWLGDYTGLKCVVNDEDCTPGQTRIRAMVDVMKNCSCIIIMTHGSCTDDLYFVEQALKVSEGKSGPTILTLADDRANVPEIARTKPFIKLPSPQEEKVVPGREALSHHKEWMGEFMSLH